jgi:TonB family protein
MRAAFYEAARQNAIAQAVTSARVEGLRGTETNSGACSVTAADARRAVFTVMRIAGTRLRLAAHFSGRLLVSLAMIVACVAIYGYGTATPLQQDPLAAARELYTNAAYQDALGALDRLAENPAANARERAIIHHYRALCLLALNRPQDATGAIEAMVGEDPLYSPPQDELSPRTRETFLQVQRRLLPSIAQERYTRAKSTYEGGRPKEAVAEFDRVLEILDAVAATGDTPSLMADLRVLATGFRQLAAAAAEAAPLPEPTSGSGAASATSGPTGESETPAAAVARQITVTPPVTLRQDVPPWPRTLPFPDPAVAVIEVVIGAEGRVLEARLQRSVDPRYDQLLLTAARNWTYRPAMRDGRATPFVKAVRVELSRER